MISVPEPLRAIRPGMAGRRMLPELLSLVDREGVAHRMRALRAFDLDGLCDALSRGPGYDFSRGNRKRMIRLLADLLTECGWLARIGDGTRWEYRLDGVPRQTEGTAESPEDDGEIRFFRHCLRLAPGYLRGQEPPVAFDPDNVRLWEDFLGCEEFQACRTVLVDRMAGAAGASPRLLDLCHGPGWGIERALAGWPEVKISAIDFTDAFSVCARARAEEARARNAARGIPSPPVEWFGSSDWRGFGYPLPFPDGAFDAILFGCGDPYVPPAGREAVYAELRRLLVPGGTLGILTRGYPDPERRLVPSFWFRVTALVHDFAESVCAGWHGFADVGEDLRMFPRLGYRGAGDPDGAMNILNGSLWILKKG